MLCDKAQKEFNMACKARTVSYSLLYGGKMAAALSRQHPRDLFDCKYMEKSNDSETKPLLFCRDTDPGRAERSSISCPCLSFPGHRDDSPPEARRA